MKIDFDSLIKDSGQQVSKRQLAREMTAKGLFQNEASAERMIHYHQSGKAKGCDYLLLQYLAERFNRPASEIINWNN